MGPIAECTFDAAHDFGAEVRHVDAKTIAKDLKKGEPVVLENLDVAGDLSLEDLTVPSVDLRNVMVHGALSLHGLHAKRLAISNARIEKKTVLDDVQIENAIAIDGSALCEGVSGVRLGVGSDFSIRSTRICRDGLPEPPRAEIEPTGVGFVLSRAKIGGDLRFESTVEKCQLSMQSVRVGARVLFRDAEVASVGPKAAALEVLGTETQSGFFFAHSTIGRTGITTLKGGVYALDKAHFIEDVQMYGLEGGAIYLSNVDSDAAFSINDANLASVSVQDVRFRGPFRMFGTKASGLLFFNKVDAREPVTFIGLSGSLFALTQSTLRCEKDCACNVESESCARNKLISIEAKGGAQIYGTTFDRPTFLGTTLGMTILGIAKSEIHAPFELYSAHLNGPIELSEVKIGAPFALVDVDVTKLILDDLTWSAPPPDVQFRGVSFKSLEVGHPDPSYTDTRAALEHFAYNRDVYENLAQQVQREGRADVARDLRLLSERRQLAGGREAAGGFLRYLWKLFLYVTIGGGVAPERAFIMLSILLGLGTWLYRDKSKMVWCGRGDEPLYSPFWYTVDLLLPILKLDDARDFRPIKTARKRIAAGRVMRVIGFVMIPLLLASAAGLLH